MSHDGEANRELVALAFHLLDAAFATGGEVEAATALRDAFDRRIRACLGDLPSPEKMRDLPEALRNEIRGRQRRAARLTHKRDAALRVIPPYGQLMARQRSYDAEIGSPRRIARHLTTSASTVVVGAALGYVLERSVGIPYATSIGIALGLLAFLSFIGHGLRSSRRMTAVETAHAAAIEGLKRELRATFDALDRAGEGGEDLDS